MAKAQGLQRDILISENIKGESVKTIIEKIFEINQSDNQLKEDYGEMYEIKPIRLFINSFGGSVYDGLALVDVIQQSDTPVHTISIGSSMSMGLWIFMYGEKRFVGENATLMYHEIATFVWDKLENLKLEVIECERLQAMIDSKIVASTKVTQDTLDDYRTRKAEWYISSEKAIELGFAEKYTK